MKTNIFPVFILFASLIYGGNNESLAQQSKIYSPEVQEKIELVEKSLGEKIKTSNTPIILQERMKEYNVPGVSIAVIKDL